MTAQSETARDAAERNAQAVMAGNISQVMADITPEAMAQMMQMAAANGGATPATLPNIQSYDITPEQATEDGAERFRVTFVAAEGRATVVATWKQVMGQWKITAVELVAAERSPDAGTS